jgi:hypothetical protein
VAGLVESGYPRSGWMRENRTHGSERGRGKRRSLGSGTDLRGHRPERAETDAVEAYARPTIPDHSHRARGLLYRPGLWTGSRHSTSGTQV